MALRLFKSGPSPIINQIRFSISPCFFNLANALMPLSKPLCGKEILQTDTILTLSSTSSKSLATLRGTESPALCFTTSELNKFSIIKDLFAISGAILLKFCKHFFETRTTLSTLLKNGISMSINIFAAP